MNFDQSWYQMVLTPFLAMFWIFVHLLWIIFWPLVNMVKTYYKEGQYSTALGAKKTTKYAELEKKRTQSVRAHLFEVCIESTFQPILQTYLSLPSFIKSVTCINLDVKKFDFTSLQFFAIATSILSLTFSFTKYFAMQQNGAMDFGFAPLSYAIVLMATFLQVSTVI